MNSPRLLIAGMGFLGREIAQQASPLGYHITGLTQSGSGNTLACDLGNPKAISALPAQTGPIDTIIHCASSGGGGAAAYRRIFLHGTATLLQTYPQARLLFTSSTSVYHQTNGEPVTETSPTKPTRETAQTLLQTEHLVQKHHGLVTRLAGLYGPQRSYLLTKFLQGQARLEEDGRRLINQIHVADAARAILHLLSLPPHQTAGQIYNIADGASLTQRDLYQQLSHLFDQPMPPTGAKPTARKRAWTHKRVTIDKLRQTGWTPQHTPFPSVAQQIAHSLGLINNNHPENLKET